MAAVAGETVEDTTEDVDDATVDAVVDTASPAACVTAGVGEAVAGAAATGETGPGEAGAGDEGAPGSEGNCAAEAGWAKITARNMASMKIAARPKQAHTQARGDHVPASLRSPIRERTGTFPSTARKLRRTLCYRAINLTM